MTAYLVVGAGPSGLGAATTLAAHARVVCVDRVPVTGGSAGWSTREVRRLTDAAVDAGVELRLGETAVRWDDHRLVVASPGRFDRLEGEHLFFAGGLRPATTANLHVGGDRPSGVLAATVAEHLLQARTRLWDTVTVLGDGPWARVVATECRALGTRVVAVAPKPAEASAWADETHRWPAALTIEGRVRVEAVRLHDGADSTSTVRVPCDAVVLAADPRPNRSVEGALLDGEPAVTYLQPVLPTSPTDRARAARDAVEAWWHERNGDPT